ncbi:MAG: carboxypeptidase regulatory-like domain-containing protein, partial [Calditrichota bacterium]
TTANGGIYYWNDVEQHRFIVEWSNMRKLGPNGNGEPLETFEVILYDARFYPTQTGDGDLLFQYLDVDNARSCYQSWDTPYATVGIGSPDLMDGLEYTYWNQLHDGAAALVDNRAIKFTTLTSFEPGSAQGRVTDAQTGNLLSNVTISTSLGPHAVTDNGGHYFLTGLPANDNYSFTASKLFYNDSTLADIVIVAGDTTPVNFALRHPEFTLNRDSVAVATLEAAQVHTNVLLTNRGNGPLFYTSRFTSLDQNRIFSLAVDGDNPHSDGVDELWDPLLWWPAGDLVNDNLIQGVAFTGEEWIVTGGNSGADTNYFYIFNRFGQYQRRIMQPVFARYGIRDIEFYNGSLICAYSQMALMIVDPEDGSQIARLEAPPQVQSLQSVTVDPSTGLFYGGSFGGGIFVMRRVDETLEVLARLDPCDPRDNAVIRPYGLAWNRDDEDGYPLFVYSNLDPRADQNIPDVSLFKVNPATGDARYLTNFSEAGEVINAACAGRGGLTITSAWSGSATVLACIFDHPEGDRIGVFELAPNSSWLDYSPRSDTLLAGQESTIEFTLDASRLTAGKYQLGVEFEHNASPGRSILPVLLDVRTAIDDQSEDSQLLHFNLAPNYPNPFNAVTALQFNLPEAGKARITVCDAAGRLTAVPADEVFPAGQNRVLFEAGKLPAGVSIYRLEWGRQQAVRKMVLVK